MDSLPDTMGAHGSADINAVRHDRRHLIAFVSDVESEQVLRAALSDLLPEPPEIRRGSVRTAYAAMQKMTSPRVLIVDLTGEDQPLKALAELATVVEPDVCVLTIGEIETVDFYREITRGLGVADYLVKPLLRDLVARHFGSFALGRGPAASTALGGRILAVTGVRGGCGATTIAVNLAWYFGVTARHHTVLLDPDLYRGNAAYQLNISAGDGLRSALEAPERLDSLLAERAAQPAADRVHVLGGQSPLGELPKFAPGAADALIEALRRRYNFIVADVPLAPVPLYHDLLLKAHQRIIVMEPSLVSMREVLRILNLPHAEADSRQAILILNRLGLPGGLSRRQIEDGLKRKVEVVIPDMPRQLRPAANLGEPAITSISQYRKIIATLARSVAGADLSEAAPAMSGQMEAKGGSWFRLRFGK